MSAARSPAFAWAAALVGGLVVLGGLAYLVRLPVPPPAAPAEPPPKVAIVDSVSNQATSLRDPTPLFLPTEYTSSRVNYVAAEPTGSFGGFPAQYVFEASELKLDLPQMEVVPDSPAAALAGDPLGAPFVSFGRESVTVQPVARRGAYVEIVESGSGRLVYGAPAYDARPPAASVPWEPMEFMAAVDAAGLVGSLVPTGRSGVDEVDAYFARYLADTLHVGQRLGPGFYRISVGP